MNNDMVINQIAHATGKSRKKVIQILKEMSSNPTIKRMLANKKINSKYLSVFPSYSVSW